jgi:hypothetical protein
LRGHNTAAEFDKAIMFLDKAIKKRMKYYKVVGAKEHLYRALKVVGAKEHLYSALISTCIEP